MSEPRQEPPRAAVALKALFWVAGAALLAIGVVGTDDRLRDHHLHAAYGNVVTWGLWVAAYIFFIGLSAGAFLVSSLVYVFGVRRFEPIGRLAVFSALVTLLLALLAIVVDLGHMDRAWHVVAYPNFKSPMAWMIFLYALYALILIVEMHFLLRADLAARRDAPGWRGRAWRLLALGARDTSTEARSRHRRIVGVLAALGVPVAVMFHGGVGALFGIVAARPHWHSGLFPILFLVSALTSGGALLVVVAAVFQRGLGHHAALVSTLGRLVLALLATDVLLQSSELVIAFRGGVPSHLEGFRLAMFGPYWQVFWGLQVGLGTLLPLALLACSRRPAITALACLLVVLGTFALRLNIVIPGLAGEELRGLMAAVHTPRLTSEYFPSAMEWMVTAGIAGLGLLLFGVGELLLPPATLEDSPHAVRV